MTAKVFFVQEGIGKAKYVVSHYDGIKTHPDGSKFFDVKIFKNKKKLEMFIKDLRKNGYKEV